MAQPANNKGLLWATWDKEALTSPDRLRDRIHPDQVRDVLENMEVAAIVGPSIGEVHVFADPDDNAILATAIAGRAELIVSGDKPGMLHLGAVEGIRIVTPREALGLLDASH